MKKPLFDLHTHTLSSGHAYGTLKENIDEAIHKGLLALGTSDHSCSMEGAPVPSFFDNYKFVRRNYSGVQLYGGTEVNVTDYEGGTDMPDSLLAKMDYVIASLHIVCIKPSTVEDNTNALIGAMKNPYIKIIGHPDDGRYPLDYEKLTAAAKKYHMVLEINSSSMAPNNSRVNARQNLLEMLPLAKKQGLRLVMGSDAHMWLDVGELTRSQELLEEVGYPEDLILNYRLEDLKYVLNR